MQILLFILISTSHQPKGKNFFEQILRQSHYLIAPTLFDCFGIVYCEASAYGIPVLTTDVGGISQAVRNGHNGFLFAADAPASDYADKIIDLYAHKDRYANLGRECRKHFETRLNWNVWEKRMNDLLVSIKEREEGTYIPVYAINMKERRKEGNISFVNLKENRNLNFTLSKHAPTPKVRLGFGTA